MHEVNIKITKGTHQQKLCLFLPSDWSELTPEQARDVIPVILGSKPSPRISLELVKLTGTGVTPSIILGFSAEQMVDVLPLVEWMYDTPLSDSIIPNFEHGNKFLKEIYHLPKGKIENWSCFEFYAADGYYNEFQENLEPFDLNRLVATLAREEDEDKKAAIERDDIRIPLKSRTEIELRAQKMHSLDPALKLYVLYFFSGCKKWLFETFGEILFEQPDTDEDGNVIEGSESDGNPLGWLGLFQKAAETNVFGTLDDVLYKTKFLDFCTWLVAKKLEHDKMMQELNSRKPGVDET